VVAVCVPIFYGAAVVYSLIEAAKIALIVLAGLTVFTGNRNLARYAFRGFIISVWLNAALLMGGLLGYDSATIMALDRWGTALSYLGSLWRGGITVWFYAAYLLAARPSWGPLALLLASTFVVYMDGARTAILILFAGALYLVLVLAAESGRLRRALLIGVSGVVLLGVALAMSGILRGEPEGAPEGVLQRVAAVAGGLQEGGFGGLEVSDEARFLMLYDAVTAIRSHPVLGSGILTTTTESIVGPQAIHMTYLQVWADLGVLGLAAYIWLVWGWIGRAPAALRRIRAMSDPVERALHHNAVFLLLVFGLIGFFHPLSTEWSEWILFLVAYAIFWSIAGGSASAIPTLSAETSRA
jgi:hypothetical protein